MRNVTKTLAVLSLLAPASAHSLGIGDITLHSALNQNLNAEISLILSAGEKVSDIKVSLAPPDKFDEAGLPWNYFLSKIKFEPVVRRDGTVVIKLSSREALKEPFLGLLLQVSWPKGSLYREFSVLVDPPQAYEQATIPVVTLPEPVRPEQTFQSPQSREIVKRPIQNTTGSSYKVTGNYGPIRRNETLWKIAERASRHENVSVEQMMIALYQENPKAFFKENVNALLAGKTLKIPKRESVVKLSRKQALAEFERHAAAWKNRTDLTPVQTEAVRESIANEDRVADNQLTLAAPSEASVTENAVITPGQEQSSIETKTADKAEDTSLPADNKAQQALAEKSPKADALQSKVDELQQQLAKMQELIALKDQQLAAFQNRPQTQPAVQSPAVAQPSPVEPVKPKIEPAPVRRQPIVPAADESTSDSYSLGIGATTLGILSVLGWFWWRKRKFDAQTTDGESMFAPPINYNPDENNAENTSAFPPAMAESNTFNVDSVGESSFLSEFTPSDFDAFDTDQGDIDPVSEADVYLAYGRYQQAEELIRHAIADQPDRDECKLKLLEIFYANENKKAFEDYVEELVAAGKKNDKGFWGKVTEMGNEICPDSLLFSSEAPSSTVKEKKQTGSRFVSLDKKEENGPTELDIHGEMDFGSDSFDELSDDNSAASKTKSDSNDFDLSSTKIDESFGSGEEQKNNESIEFDLSSLSSDSKDLDSDLNDERTSKAPINSDQADEGYDFESFDFNLSDDAIEKTEINNVDLTDSEERNNLLEGFPIEDDFDFFDSSNNAEGQDSKQDVEFGVSDLTDMDEFETKLDLARAYSDMGDDLSAREIIDEVLVKGSDEQKKLAAKLLDDLG